MERRGRSPGGRAAPATAPCPARRMCWIRVPVVGQAARLRVRPAAHQDQRGRVQVDRAPGQKLHGRGTVRHRRARPPPPATDCDCSGTGRQGAPGRAEAAGRDPGSPVSRSGVFSSGREMVSARARRAPASCTSDQTRRQSSFNPDVRPALPEVAPRGCVQQVAEAVDEFLGERLRIAAGDSRGTGASRPARNPPARPGRRRAAAPASGRGGPAAPCCRTGGLAVDGSAQAVLHAGSLSRDGSQGMRTRIVCRLARVWVWVERGPLTQAPSPVAGRAFLGTSVGLGHLEAVREGVAVVDEDGVVPGDPGPAGDAGTDGVCGCRHGPRFRPGSRTGCR